MQEAKQYQTMAISPNKKTPEKDKFCKKNLNFLQQNGILQLNSTCTSEYHDP